MPSTTPLFGFPYPLGTDRVQDGDNAIGALALQVERQLSGTDGTVQSAPYRSQAGGVTGPANLAQTDRVQASLTFAVNRFTQPPIVIASASSNGYLAASTGPATTTSVSLRIQNVGAAAVTGVYYWFWAVQQTPTASNALTRMLEDMAVPGDPYTATCDTADCGNAGQPIPVIWDDPEGSAPVVYCGVCGELITDVVGA